jgi:hypothetical protein
MHEPETRMEMPNQVVTHRRIKQQSTRICSFAILLLSSLFPVQAQTAKAATSTVIPFRYDVADEITLSGLVSSVLMKADSGMIPGSHVLLASPTGPVDASLGRFGLGGVGAPSVTAGQQIEATGVVTRIKDKPVFLVRILKVGGKLYNVRNQHGVALSPQARERAGLANQKGGSR